jgi:hypothetical protein
MDYVIISFAAFCTSALTLFSGFGLGTLLLPAFALFFPVDLSVAMTAVVHFLNNLFKLALLRKWADRSVVIRFGLPAALAAFPGAWLLFWLSDLEPVATWTLGETTGIVTPVKLIVAVLMAGFAALELAPRAGDRLLPRSQWLLGGALSGFFGGLSGHQGAFRSAFLVRAGLSREAFIATGIVIACMVDVTRMGVYARHFVSSGIEAHAGLLLCVLGAAFLGAWIGNRYSHGVTMRTIRLLVAAMLFGVAVVLGLGMT